uniref:Uncharacterized protein n=1 Tax=Pyxicephalus adspersus TaxID=30357 RepID=A0AAV3ABH4_PYXAD|nr:TPA: hypothetical protein GDO54_011593 [Pyxicephalus adspersus]
MLEKTATRHLASGFMRCRTLDPTSPLWFGLSRLSTAPLIQEATADGLIGSRTLPYDAIPTTGRSAWFNLFQFWRKNSFQNMHHVMEENFQRLGPIYSNGEPWRSDRIILNKEVLSLSGVKKFLPFLNEAAADFVTFMRKRMNKNTRGSLTVDLYADLFRFTLEASSYVLYGQRLGLLEEYPNADSLRFIGAVETMIKTTLPLVYYPHQILQLFHSRLWNDHMQAWDIIFEQADRCIQNIYQEFCLGQERGYSGIMAELLLQGELPLDSIKANVTELMAGGVDTTAMPLLFTLFELARNPPVQRELREEIRKAEAQNPNDLNQLLNSLPLLKGAIKETLRLYPVGITVQRHLTKDITLHNYHVPSGVRHPTLQ